MIKPMAMEFLFIWMELNMKANEFAINSMEKAQKYGQMELLLKEIISKEKNKV